MKKIWSLLGGVPFLFSGVSQATVTVTKDWEIVADIGTSYASGNTDSAFITVGIKGKKESERNINAFKVSYAYGEEDGSTTSDSLLADASWKRNLNDHSYAGLRLDLRHDDLADINYRVSLSALFGHFLIKDEKTKLSIEGGPGFTFEEVGSVSDEYFSFYVGEAFEHQLRPDTKIYQKVAWLTPGEDLDDFQIVAEVSLETKLTESLNFKVALENKYENQPAPGRQSNDIRIVTGISYKF